MNRLLKATAIGLMTIFAPVTVLADDNPLAEFLKVPGATTTLPVEAAKKPFPFDFAKAAQSSFDNFHYQLGGDHALYYNKNLSELLPTAYSAPHPDFLPLERAIDASIGDAVRFTPAEGEMSLSEYIVHPNHRPPNSTGLRPTLKAPGRTWRESHNVA